jgi:hypothetical protein
MYKILSNILAVKAEFWWENLRVRPLGRPRHRWEDNIKLDFQEVGWWCMDWIDLAQERAGGGHL